MYYMAENPWRRLTLKCLCCEKLFSQCLCVIKIPQSIGQESQIQEKLLFMVSCSWEKSLQCQPCLPSPTASRTEPIFKSFYLKGGQSLKKGIRKRIMKFSNGDKRKREKTKRRTPPCNSSPLPKKTTTQMLKCTDGSICAKEQFKGLHSPTRPLEIVTPGIYDWGPRSYEIKRDSLTKLNWAVFHSLHRFWLIQRTLAVNAGCQLLPYSVFIIGVEVGGDKSREEA